MKKEGKTKGFLGALSFLLGFSLFLWAVMDISIINKIMLTAGIITMIASWNLVKPNLKGVKK